MCLLITMVLMGAINLVTCNPDDPYTKECEPPHGYFPLNDSYIFHLNDSTINPYYPYFGLKPIERCCPACSQCIDIGGYCKLRWLPEIYPEWCDFTSIPECRDYQCACCIKCADDKCSPCSETGGECRIECRSDEIEDLNNKCLFHANDDGRSEGCKCCKRCEATSECTEAYGKCSTDPDDCPHGSFASTGCCGGCYCCKPVLQPVTGSNCEYSGGYCTESDECATGYYPCPRECSKTLFNEGLQTIAFGTCCIPKQTGHINRIDQKVIMMDQDFIPQQQEQQHSRHHPRQLLD